MDTSKLDREVRDSLWEIAEETCSEAMGPGFCLACGYESEDQIEPDATGLDCDACGASGTVHSAPIILGVI